MSAKSETLRVLPYFSDVSDDLLEEVASTSEEVEIPDGTVVIEEGSDSDEMYVVISGEMIVTKRTAGRDVEVGRVGPGDVVGEIALLDEAPRTATVTAKGPTRAIRIPALAFEELLSDPHVVRRMFRTVTSRLRSIEDTLRHEERMSALGRMAAQLMHELNNPAAAVARSTTELARLQREMGEEASALGAAFGGPELVPPPVQEMTALQRSETQEAVVAYLTELGAAEPWDLAPALVAIGWTADSLREALASSDSDVRPHLARWLGLSAAIGQLLQDLGIGADRISELVRVVKEYSFLDQAPIQEIDPTDGIEDTLILLKHKLADIEVILDFEENLPTVEAAGRDLNQVWTNLIDNAADAMDGSGKLTITARREGSDVVVTVADTGPGIPEETVARIFDPFFTTKEPGKGTGLGLHTVHNIVSRSGGTITVRSDGSGTAFEVRLPAVS